MGAIVVAFVVNKEKAAGEHGCRKQMVMVGYSGEYLRGG